VVSDLLGKEGSVDGVVLGALRGRERDSDDGECDLDELHFLCA
jgi:hypothetical protein